MQNGVLLTVLFNQHSIFRSPTFRVFNLSIYCTLLFSQQYLPSPAVNEFATPALMHVNKRKGKKGTAAFLAVPS